MAWLTNWNYRKLITVNGSTAGAQTDYQMKITVHKGSGTDTSTDIFAGNNVNNDFSDIRFTAQDGTLLNYWIESFTSGTSAVVWIKIPYMPVSPDTTQIYLYYGNPSATSASNGTNTFIFFDDFESGNLSKWATPGGATNQTAHVHSGTNSMYAYNNNGTQSGPFGTIGNKYVLDFWMYDSGQNARSEVWAGFANSVANNFRFVLAARYDNTYWTYFTPSTPSGIYANTPFARTRNAYSKITIIYNGGSDIRYTINNGTLQSVTVPWSDGVNDIWTGYGWGGQYEYLDDFRVRKYASPEPTWGASASEETIIPFLPSWNYRKAITISNTNISTLTDYQVPITIDTATLISSGKMLSNCNDIRFTSSDGSTLLNYWIESGQNTSSTKIWVKIPSIPVGTNTIYMYYDNPPASLASNGINTFELFDDFEDGSINTNIWTISGSPTESNGTLVLNASGMYLQSKSSWNRNIAVKYNANMATTSSGYTWIGLRDVSNTPALHISANDDVAGKVKGLAGNPSSVFTPVLSNVNEIHTYELSYMTNEAKFWVDNVYNSVLTSQIGTSALPVTIRNYSGGNTMTVYWILVRKYATTEPIVSALGTEEITSATGLLNISSTPAGASIYIDNVLQIGLSTPATISGIITGTHTYGLTLAGYNDTTGTFTIVTEQTTVITETLTLLPFLAGWNYRKPITISNSGSTLTDYQVSITIDTATLISSGKMLSSCNDIRFTSGGSSTLLNYWIESGQNTTSTKIWVKIPSIITGSNTIYLYYGNSLATSASNGTNTFELFDNFDDGTIDTSKWNTTGTPTESGGLITADTQNEAVVSKTVWNQNVSCRVKGTTSATQTSNFGFRNLDGLPFINIMGNYIPGYVNGVNRVGSINDPTSAFHAMGTTHIYEVTWLSTRVEYWVDNAFFEAKTNTANIPTSALPVEVYNNNNGGSTTADWILVRKYASIEPTLSEMGTEEITSEVGLLNISSTPTGASIYIDDVLQTGLSTPATVSDIPSGTHTYKLTLAGYNDITGTFTIVTGQTTVITETLALFSLLAGWNYRKPITISNTNVSTLIDYQVPVTIDTTTLISSGKMLSNGNDIRFTSSDGLTNLNYWIESDINSSSTKIWVKIPSIIPGSNAIYLYYGNSLAIATSSIANTFIREIGGASPVKGSWSLDGNTLDTSGNAYHATLYGGMGYATGKFDQAGSFDGINDYIVMPNYFNLKPATLEFWFKANALTGDPMLFGKVGGGATNGYIQYYLNQLRFYAPGNTLTVNWGAISLNTWHHLVLVITGTQHLAYLDGSLIGSPVSSTLALATGNYNFRLGSYESSAYYNGLIDEVRIYDRALTQAEITDLYNNYGYVTPNYPGKELIRKYISPEPTFSTIGTEEITSEIGLLNISSTPVGASIYIDDMLQIGLITPAIVSDIITGNHTYKLTLAGYNDITGTFATVTGQTTVITETLVPLSFLAGWGYRKLITISNSGSALTDYQVPITIDTATLISSGKMLSNCNDIRFTSGGSSTLLNYWIESGINTSSTKIWVKIPSITTGSNTIYLYYGNSSATATSSTTNTFIRVIGSDVSQPVKGAWRFDETSGNASDYSGNNNTGVLVNSPTYTTGKFGNALNFATASSQYVNTGASSTTDVAAGNANFTYAAWVNTASYSGYTIIINRGIMSSLIYYPWVNLNYNNGIAMFGMLGTSPNGGGYCTAITSIKDNNWHYVVGVRNGLTLYLYIDGILDVSLPIANRTYGSTSEPLYFCANHFMGPGDRLDVYSNGKIDEPRIYNVALTQAEITDLHNNYGYVTPNYPGRELVRKYTSLEPMFSTIGTEEITTSVGSVIFDSSPQGAKIFIDGSDTGLLTPSTVTGIPEGIHTYTLSILGYMSATGTVTIVSGTTINISQILTPLPFITGWNKRKLKTINGTTAGTQTNYPMMFNVNSGSGIDSGNTIYLGGNARTDFGDLRFTDSNNNLLNYWIESYTSGTNAVVWINIPSIPASPSQTPIYIYYQNPSATSVSNGDNTFNLFDNFDGTSVNATKWTIGGSPAVSGGLIDLSNGCTARYVLSNQTFDGRQYAVRARWELLPLPSSGSVYESRMGLGWTNTALNHYAVAYHVAQYNTLHNKLFADYGANYTSHPFVDNTFYISTFYMDATYHPIITLDDGTTNTSTTVLDATYNKAYLGVPCSNSKADWVLIRKFASPEPTLGASAPEETQFISGWRRRKSITINGSTAGSQTNYQIKTTVHKGTGTDTITDIYLGINVKDDFSDLRFTDSDGITLLNYWIESYTFGWGATVWINIPSIPASPGTTSAYLYYDNPSATTASNIDNTFILGDEFNGPSLDGSKWIERGGPGTITVGGGILTYAHPTTIGESKIESISSYTPGKAIRIRNNLPNASGAYVWWAFGFQIYPYVSPYQRILASKDTSNNALYTVESTEVLINTNWTLGSYTTKEICWDDANNNISWFEDDIQKTGSPYTTGANIPGESLAIELARGNRCTSMIDWVVVRKYTSPEPTLGSIGIEETTTNVGNVAFDSSPQGADIFINETNTGLLTPITISLPEGTYAYRLSKSGYSDATGSVTVVGNTTVSISQILTPPPSFLVGWNRRKLKSITGTTSGVQTNYQIMLKVNFASGTDSGNTIYLEGNARTDFGDLRFTDSNNNLLNYWIESFISGGSALAWINIPSIPMGPGTTSIYVYYDNPSATSASNGENTFDLFDDFLGSSLNTTLWEGSTTKASLSGGIMTYTSATGDYYILSKQAYSSPMILRTRNNMGSGTSDFGFQVSPYVSPYQMIESYASSMVFRETGEVIRPSNITTGSYTTKEIRWNGTNNIVRWYDNDTECLNSPFTDGANIPDIPLRVLPARVNQGQTVYVDWILLRKHTFPEPTWGIAGVETTGSVSISSTPAGASIYVDNVLQTGLSTPAMVSGIIPGTHTYRLTKSGYNDVTGTFTITAGLTSLVSVTMILTTGAVSITSTPPGASIYIDNILQAGLTTPATVTNLAPGTHSYKLSLAGYNDATGTFVITDGLTATVTETLIITTGSVSIISTPPGVSIYIDNALQTGIITPTVIPNLIPGTHTYKLTLSGYDDNIGSFVVTGNQTTILSITMVLTTGSLTITSTPPGASISIDNGPPIGTLTPTTITDIVPGTHTYTLSLSGYNDATGTFVITGWQNTTLSVTMVLTTGSLSIISTPSGAEIFIDNIDQNVTTPYTVTGIIPGTHTYRLIKSGYNDSIGQFTIVDSQTATVATSLILIVGSISFDSTPSGAKIFLDDTDTGYVTPNTINNVIPGTHTYGLTLVDYHDATGNVDVVDSQTATITATLIPTFGNVTFVSTPSGAKIILDGTDTGLTSPFTINDVSEGTHTYALSITGYYDSTGTLTVVGGQPQTITETMVLITGEITFSTTPIGATIFLDNVNQGITTPSTVTGIVPGDHTYRLTLADYHDYTGTTTVIGAQTAIVTAILTPTIGNISFISTPPGSEIFLDNVDTGLMTPVTVTGMLEGAHTYRLVLAGYYDYIGTVTVTGGETATVTATEVLITGEISFDTTPVGAKIFVDNVNTGLVTPAAATNIVPGTHTYTLSLVGYYDSTGSTTVVGGQTTTVTAALTLIVGSISFDTTPAGANIFIDGMDTGTTTPTTISGIVPGDHPYTLSLAGYYDSTGSTTVVGGQTTTVTTGLTLIVGSMSFDTTPSGASIFIDGVDIGQVTPATITGIIPGNHTYTLLLGGYYSETSTTTVIGGQTVPIPVTMVLITGDISFSSMPIGARIFLDNIDTGLITPAIMTGIVPGTHAYKLTLTDYHDLAGSVNVIEAQTSTVTTTLLPTLGNVSFDSTPMGARIFLDGFSSGLVTPDTMANVLEGTHTYVLTLSGYYNYSGSIIVVGGQTAPVIVTMELIVGSMSFTSTPAGANIIIDGTDTHQLTPATISNIVPGMHTYTLSLADYHNYTDNIEVIGGQTAAVTAILSPTRGNITFGSAPEGANILVDDIDTGLVTPNTVTNILEGSHVYTLSLAGYYDDTGHITVIGGQTASVTSTLILIVGSVSFNSIPAGANIILDGTDTGLITPFTITNMVPGVHTYKLTLADYHDHLGHTTVVGEQTTIVSISLLPTLGKVSFVSTPSGAKIFLDNIDTNQLTPATIENILEGTHTYTLSLSGYHSLSDSITVVGGQTSNITTTLTLIVGSITFNSVPTGADIFVDNIGTGLKTPSTMANVLPGTHSYKLTLADYHDFTGSIDVIGDQTVNVMDTLIPTFGSISFASTPSGAKIFLDNADTGLITPFTINNVSEGAHTYALSFNGYHDATGNVTIAGGQTSTATETLTLIVGSISFTSTPSGATIFIDGTSQNLTTPYTVTGILPGVHTYKLTLTDYHDYTDSVTVVGDQTVTATATLTSIFGDISFASTPEGAEIFLDDVDTGLTTPATATHILEGVHTYRLVLAGYYDYTGTVTITGGQTATLTATETLITGEISFVSTPSGARIIVNETDTGMTTPATVTNLVPGTYTYTLSLSGYHDSAGAATVVDGQTAAVTAALTLIVGNISFNTTPVGAKIFLDNVDTGLMTPNTMTNILPGDHTYTLSLSGYYDSAGTATVADSQTTIVTSVLTLITGSISFVSTPSGAKVFVDGVDTTQITPVTITNIVPGDHTYTLSLAGYYDYTGTTTVTGGQTAAVTTTPTLITGSISFVSTPSGAKIFLDNVDTGLMTPNTVPNIIPGSHTYTLLLSEYHDYTGTTTVTGGQTTTVTSVLISTMGNISFSSSPTGADIFLDNTDTGLTAPSTLTNILEGVHSYSLKSAGYYDSNGSIEVIGGQTVSVSETLVLMVGGISFDSTPEGAEIFIDGTDAHQTTPSTVTNLVIGTHTYTLKSTGYYDYMGSINVVAGQTVTVSAVLMLMTGSISINSIPAGSEIFIDGTDIHQVTPATVTDLPIGNHVYTLKLACYADYSSSVNIPAGQTIPISAPLTLLTGDAHFTSAPSGAEIFIDGTDTGLITPATVTNIYCGSHSYALKTICYQDYSGTVVITGGQTINVSTTLVPMYGSIYFTSQPSGARIFIDEVDTGQSTPASITGVLACSHTYRLKISGHYDFIGRVKVVPNMIVNVAINHHTLETGCRQFSSVPEGAKVSIDGYTYGIFTPVKVCGIPIGVHTSSLEGTFSIGVGGKGCRQFNSVPKGARVFIDGRDTGAITPTKIYGISVGTHTYRLDGTFELHLGEETESD